MEGQGSESERRIETITVRLADAKGFRQRVGLGQLQPCQYPPPHFRSLGPADEFTYFNAATAPPPAEEKTGEEDDASDCFGADFVVASVGIGGVWGQGWATWFWSLGLVS